MLFSGFSEPEVLENPVRSDRTAHNWPCSMTGAMSHETPGSQDALMNWVVVYYKVVKTIGFYHKRHFCFQELCFFSNVLMVLEDTDGSRRELKK